MARRTPYTKVNRRNFVQPDHVEGMGDKLFMGFQCLSKACTNFIFFPEEDYSPDFEITCPSCQFVMKAGEAVTLYEYDLEDRRDGSIIESGAFQILHDDYVNEAHRFKYCIICGAMKPVEAFGKHGARQSGRQGECKLCKDVYNSLKNQTRLTEQHREASQKRRLYTQFDTERINIPTIYERFESKCFKCNADLSEGDDGQRARIANLDHTLPVFYLWPLTTHNATLLCDEHNAQKAGHWPREFYTDAELRRLAALTGIEYRVMAGEPHFNPEALARLYDAAFVEQLFEKFARYPNELLRLRNRILQMTGFDFLSVAPRLSHDWTRKADELLD